MYKILDELSKLSENQAVTATATTVGANIDGINIGDVSYVAILNVTGATGTFDGANNYTVALEASDALGGAYKQVGNLATILADGQHEVGFTANQLNSIVPNANHFRVTSTKVGTTATGITHTAFISKV